MQSSSAFVKAKTDWPLPSFKCPALLLREPLGLSSLWSLENIPMCVDFRPRFYFLSFPILVSLTTLFLLLVCWESFPSVSLCIMATMFWVFFVLFCFVNIRIFFVTHSFSLWCTLTSLSFVTHWSWCQSWAQFICQLASKHHWYSLTMALDTFNVLRA